LKYYKILEDDYRKIYFKNAKPIKSKNKEYYRCLYCGKLFEKGNIEVDHIIPKTRFMAGIIWNPNRYWNLGAACRYCNAKKSKKVDYRIIQGFKNKNFGNILFSKYNSSRYTKENKFISLIIIFLIICIYFISNLIFLLLIPINLIINYFKILIIFLFNGFEFLICKLKI